MPDDLESEDRSHQAGVGSGRASKLVVYANGSFEVPAATRSSRSCSVTGTPSGHAIGR